MCEMGREGALLERAVLERGVARAEAGEGPELHPLEDAPAEGGRATAEGSLRPGPIG